MELWGEYKSLKQQASLQYLNKNDTCNSFDFKNMAVNVKYVYVILYLLITLDKQTQSVATRSNYSVRINE